MRISLFSAAGLCCAAALQAAPDPDSRPPSSRPPTAPEQADPACPPEGEPRPAIKALGGSRHELNGITFNADTRAITLPCKVNMTEGLLEYALVHEAGKVHESFLSTVVSPYDLNVVLLLLNYKAGTAFFDHSDKKAGAVLVKNPKIDPAANLLVTLDWKDTAGRPRTARLESLLLNVEKKAPVTEGPFVYTGSMVLDDGLFMAKDTGSILALYADAAALINNPREGNDNDDIWVTDNSKAPPKGTPVTLTLSPSPAK